jgi:hypothetical protein
MQSHSSLSNVALSSRKPEYAYRIAIVAAALILLLTWFTGIP